MKLLLHKGVLIVRTLHRERIGGVVADAQSHSHFAMALTAEQRSSPWKLRLTRPRRQHGAAVNRQEHPLSAMEPTAKYSGLNTIGSAFCI